MGSTSWSPSFQDVSSCPLSDCSFCADTLCRQVLSLYAQLPPPNQLLCVFIRVISIPVPGSRYPPDSEHKKKTLSSIALIEYHGERALSRSFYLTPSYLAPHTSHLTPRTSHLTPRTLLLRKFFSLNSSCAFGLLSLISKNDLACGSSFVFDSLLPTGFRPRKFSSLGSTFAYQLGLINKEAVFVKLELRLRLVLANLRQRPRLWFELRLRLALANLRQRPRLQAFGLYSAFRSSQ